MCIWECRYSRRPEESIGHSGAEATGSVSHSLWVLETELMSSARAISYSNHRAISSASHEFICYNSY